MLEAERPAGSTLLPPRGVGVADERMAGVGATGADRTGAGVLPMRGAAGAAETGGAGRLRPDPGVPGDAERVVTGADIVGTTERGGGATDLGAGADGTVTLDGPEGLPAGDVRPRSKVRKGAGLDGGVTMSLREGVGRDRSSMPGLDRPRSVRGSVTGNVGAGERRSNRVGCCTVLRGGTTSRLAGDVMTGLPVGRSAPGGGLLRTVEPARDGGAALTTPESAGGELGVAADVEAAGEAPGVELNDRRAGALRPVMLGARCGAEAARPGAGPIAVGRRPELV